MADLTPSPTPSQTLPPTATPTLPPTPEPTMAPYQVSGNHATIKVQKPDLTVKAGEQVEMVVAFKNSSISSGIKFSSYATGGTTTDLQTGNYAYFTWGSGGGSLHHWNTKEGEDTVYYGNVTVSANTEPGLYRVPYTWTVKYSVNGHEGEENLTFYVTFRVVE